MGAVVVVVVAIAAWLGLSWLGTYRQAQAVQADVTTLRTALDAREWSAVTAQVPAVASSTADLVKSTEGVPWRLLSSMPVVGSTATAVTDLSAALSGVVRAAEPLTPYAERIVAGEIRRPDGSIDLTSMEEVAPLLDRLAIAMGSASSRLSGVDAASVRPEVADPLVELRDELAAAVPSVETAASIVTWLPGMLGASGSRDWLVMLQNPAEARGSGGFIGGYVILTADDGRIAISSTGTSSELATTPIPSDDAPEDSTVIWGDILERWGAFNLTPHFPLTGSLAAAGMDARGTPVDGVIAVDPATVAAMLAVTGPVTAEGKTITADDVEKFFTVAAYTEYPDNAERDVVSMALVQAVFQAFLGASWEPTQLADALRTPVEESRLLVWSADESEQEWLVGTPVGGSVPDQPGSVVAVAFNNTAENKMDAFVATSVDYVPGRCPTASVQSSHLTVGLRNDAPAGLPRAGGNYGFVDRPDAPEGATEMLVMIYAPVGANYLSSQVDGVDAPLYLGAERNRQVWWTKVTLDRGQERAIDVSFEEPTVLGVEPRVVAQPMVIDEVVTVTPDPGC